MDVSFFCREYQPRKHWRRERMIHHAVGEHLIVQQSVECISIFKHDVWVGDVVLCCFTSMYTHLVYRLEKEKAKSRMRHWFPFCFACPLFNVFFHILVCAMESSDGIINLFSKITFHGMSLSIRCWPLCWKIIGFMLLKIKDEIMLRRSQIKLNAKVLCSLFMRLLTLQRSVLELFDWKLFRSYLWWTLKIFLRNEILYQIVLFLD